MKKKINVKIIPKSRQNEIVGYRNEILIIKLKEIPEKGKANKVLIKFLSKEWKLPQKNFQIIKGELDRLKTLEIENFKKLDL